MLEGLDQVDWANIGLHVYSSRPQEEIPTVIREVLSADETIRSEALAFLFGEGQDIGNIHDTTPYIIPFMIEILSEPLTDGKEDILSHLVRMSGLYIYVGGGDIYSIHELRTKILTYDALESGVSVYSELLKHELVKVRELAATLLGVMSESAGSVMPKLVQAFVDENSEGVKAVLVEACGRLLSTTDFRQHLLRKQYESWFRELVDESPLLKVRQAAAKASICAAKSSLWNHHLDESDISPRVAGILVEQYLAESDKDYMREINRTEIVRLLARLQDPEPLLSLLEHPDTTPDEAQILARGLLWNVFQNGWSAEDFWQYRLSGQSTQANLYHIYHSHLALPVQDPLKQVFRRILTVDKIWSLPTNLFSFFFDLPDSRDELRALIEKNDLFFIES